MSETRKLFESFKSNLNEIDLGQEKEELFNLIKGYNPNAKKENYIKKTKSQMLNILTKLQNKKPKKQQEKIKQPEKSKVDLNPDYDTDESIASKTDSDIGLEYFDDLNESEINVPIEKFKKEFDEEYAFLYDNYDRVAGYDEALEEFDTRIKSSESFKNFVSEFCKYRGDFISSDREAVAFMFALEKYMTD